MMIKGRGSKGNLLTRETVNRIVQKEVGISTLSARKIWYDDVVGRLNDEQRGKLIGAFKGGDKILTLYKSGHYRLSNFDLSNRSKKGWFILKNGFQIVPLLRCITNLKKNYTM
jgi:topoisomerase-4 subunit A